MKWAFFGSIHSNIYALEAVLEEIEKFDTDDVICLGDLVGYYNEPRRVVEKIRNSKKIESVVGNHDKSIIGEYAEKTEDKEIIKTDAYNSGSFLCTSEKIELVDSPKENLKFLRSLPAVVEGKNYLAAHANPFSTDFKNIFEWDDYMYYMENALKSEKKFILTCHGDKSKILKIRENKDYEIISTGADDEFRIGIKDIEDRERYWINVGTSGGPYLRSDKPCAEICLIQQDKKEAIILIRRIQYNGYRLVNELENNFFYKNLEMTKKISRQFKEHGLYEKVEDTHSSRKTSGIIGMMF